MKKLRWVMLLIVALTISGGLFAVHRNADAAIVTEQFYYSTGVNVLDVQQIETVPAITLEFDPLLDSQWRVYWDAQGIYIVSITTTKDRHNAFKVNWADNLIGTQLDEVKTATTHDLKFSLIRVSMQNRYDDLLARNCQNVPLQVVDLLDAGNIRCPAQ